MTAQPDPPPATVRAQLLATEHWSLLATRSQTWSEVMGRISAQFTFASAALVVLALVVQVTGFDETFRLLAIALTAFVLITGTMTTIRVFNASIDDLRLVGAMNRLRAAYVDLDPGITEYLTTGWTEDAAGIAQTYTMGAPRRTTQVLGSAAMFMVVVNSIIAGFLAALLADSGQVGRVGAVALALLAGAGYVFAFVVTLHQSWRRDLGS